MKKPKVKKRNGYWLLYTDKKRIFKCFNINTTNLIYNLLKGELNK